MSDRFKWWSETIWWTITLLAFVVFALLGLVPDAGGFAGFAVAMLFGVMLWAIGYLLHLLTVRVAEHLVERRRSNGRRAVGSDRGEAGS